MNVQQMSLLDVKPTKKVINKTQIKNTEKTAKNKIQDFGGKIGGAKKDRWRVLLQALSEYNINDIITQPLSKIFPEPKYNQLLSEGKDPIYVGMLHAIRDEASILKRGKISDYEGKKISQLFNLIEKLSTDNKFLQSIIENGNNNKNIIEKILYKAEMYKECGHDVTLKNYELNEINTENGMVYKIKNRSMYHYFLSARERSDVIQQFSEYIEGQENNQGKRKKEIEFLIVRKDRDDGVEYSVGVELHGRLISLSEPMQSKEEAREYKEKNKEFLLQKLEDLKNIPNERKATNAPRKGEDYRHGRDVSPEDFEKTFHFYGVQFGNWVENDRRQMDLNDSYDALLDLASVLKVSPQALSLNGDLALAFGARGTGRYNAHFERENPSIDLQTPVINLTKTRGSGSLAHEWFHALDNYFSRTDGKKFCFLSDSMYFQFASNSKVRNEVLAAWGNLVNVINDSTMKTRSMLIDCTRSKPYWSTKIEMAARAFETWIISKLEQKDCLNDYLANVVDEKSWPYTRVSEYPYPTKEEMPEISAAFERLFSTLEEHKTEKGIALASLADVDTLLENKREMESLTVDNLQDIVQTLEKRFPNALDTYIVQSIDELPETLQIQTLEGACHNGQVCLVADNLFSKERVVDVWMHEQLVHNGLRSLLTDSEREQLMSSLYLEFGGTSNDVIHEISGKYGLDPIQDRTQLMEEVLGHLAEKKWHSLLSPSEDTLWWKIVQKVSDVLTSVKNHFCKTEKQTQEKSVDQIMTALGKYLLQGIDSSEELKNIVSQNRGKNYENKFLNGFYAEMKSAGFDEKVYEDELQEWQCPWNISSFAEWKTSDSPENDGKHWAETVLYDLTENFPEKIASDVEKFNFNIYNDNELANLSKDYINTFLESYDKNMMQYDPKYDVNETIAEYRINPACPWLTEKFDDWFLPDPKLAAEKHAQKIYLQNNTVHKKSKITSSLSMN